MSLLLSVYAALAIADPVPPSIPNATIEQFDFRIADRWSCLSADRDAAIAKRCEERTAPQRFQGVWRVGFETSIFTFAGHPSCIEARDAARCIDIEGIGLPWPKQDACIQEFEVDFIGRRSVVPVPGHLSAPFYRVTVDRMLSAKRLADPYDEDCDPRLHPELNESEK